MKHLNSVYDRLITQERSYRKSGIYRSSWENKSASLYDLAKGSRVLDLISDIIGPDIMCWTIQFFSKPPGDTRVISWHQDISYWGLLPPNIITVWIAFDDVDQENGCMQVVPKSHLFGRIPFKVRYGNAYNPEGQFVEAPDRFGDKTFNIELKLGEASIHSCLLLHGSLENQSNRRRCGLAIRYMTPDVENVNKKSPNDAILCKGEDRFDIWPLRNRPRDI